VVDTTGAGDTFLGFLLAELFADKDYTRLARVRAAVAFASLAAALSVKKLGAMGSIPTRASVIEAKESGVN
jgi:ribokinase